MPASSEPLVDLKASIDAVFEAGPEAFADGETLQGLYAQLERLSCAATLSTGAFDAGDEWSVAGARSAAAWISTERRLPRPSVQRRVRLARALRHMPEAEQAWSTGAINLAQVSLLAGARSSHTAEAFERDEAMLVNEAAKLRHASFARVIAYWEQLNDPDRDDRNAKKILEGRNFFLSPGLDGVGFFKGAFDPLGHAAFAKVFRAIERELFEADWAEARERLGREPTPADLRRTAPQRRADALVEMARRAGAVPPGARMPGPLFTVLVGYETFAGRICELANGTVVSPGSLVPWLTDAHVERVVFDGPSRVIDVGPHRRLFTGATRRAVEIRDRECFHPYCDVSFEECEIDHQIPFSWGGPTITDNGRPACPFHNKERHRRPQGPEPPDPLDEPEPPEPPEPPH